MNTVYNDFPVVRCPLCFKALTEHEFLIRFCPSDEGMHEPPLWEQFKCTPLNLEEKIKCWRPECAARKKLAGMVYLLHVGCAARNPFWKPAGPDGEGTVQVESEILIEFQQADPGGEVQRRREHAIVRHWQLGMLRAPLRFPDLASRPEMWFPQILLRAMFECVAGRQLGVRVKLCGARGVGKSILATMALVGSNLGNRNYMGNYVYLSPGHVGVAYDEFLHAVYPFQLLDAGRTKGTWWVPRTEKAYVNLKAVFMTGAPTPGQADPPPDRHGLAVKILTQIKNNASGEEKRMELDREFSSLLLYDTAGEEAIGEDWERFRQLDECMDVVAAVVSPTDFIEFKHVSDPAKDPQNSSVGVAVKLLESVTNREAVRCLIVTKLDMVHYTEFGKETEFQEALARIKNEHNPDPGQERELLLRMLLCGGEGGAQFLQAQLARMVANYSKIHRVFFIWTEGADDPSRYPVTHGMSKFAAWCERGAKPETFRAHTLSGVVR